MLQSAMHPSSSGAAAGSDIDRLNEEWKNIGFATGPADRKLAEAALKNIYAAAGLRAPSKIVWCGSPFSQGLARAIALDADFADQVVKITWDHIMNPEKTKVISNIAESFRGSMRLFDTGAVKNNLLDAIKRGVRAAMMERCRAKLAEQVRDAAGEPVWDSVWNSVWDSVGEPAWRGIDAGMRKLASTQEKSALDLGIQASLQGWAGDCVKNAAWENPMDQAWANIRNSVSAKTRVAVWEGVWRALQNAIWENVVTRIGEQVKACGNDSAQCSGYGQHDAYWLAFYAYFRDAQGLTAETEPVSAMFDLAKSAGWFIPHANVCWVCERPVELRRDASGRLQAKQGPAIRYPDGWVLHGDEGSLRAQAALQPA